MAADKALWMPLLVESGNDLVENALLALGTDVLGGQFALVAVLAEETSLDGEVGSDWRLALVANEAILVELETINVEISTRNRLSALVAAVVRNLNLLFL